MKTKILKCIDSMITMSKCVIDLRLRALLLFNMIFFLVAGQFVLKSSQILCMHLVPQISHDPQAIIW